MSNATNKRLVSGFLPLALVMIGVAATGLGLRGGDRSLALAGSSVACIAAVWGAVYLRVRGRSNDAFELPEDPDFAGNPL